jgi:tRNA synthetases class I (C) catalytic domain
VYYYTLCAVCGWIPQGAVAGMAHRSGLRSQMSSSCHASHHRYIDEFHEDMRQLGCVPPELEPRATAHIPAMIDTINKIIDNGHAYVVGNDVFFDIATLPGYGKLSRHTPQVPGFGVHHAYLACVSNCCCASRCTPTGLLGCLYDTYA